MRQAVITDHIVADLYGNEFSNLFVFPAGELSKTRKTKEQLENALIENGYGRDTVIWAVGGGIVLDLVGFLASTFCRGVDVVFVPTTLLAMVDASIGGKNGVNTEHGKNLIGTFYNPVETVIDLRYLETLPQKELWNGYVEMLKAGLVKDPAFFEGLSEMALAEAIERARQIKSEIVANDPREKGIRKFLNLGHTIGHGIEAASNYEISHGEAVATGIILEARIAYNLGILSASSLDRITSPFSEPKLTIDRDLVLQAMRFDKKGKSQFVLLKEIGVPILQEVADEVVKDALCTC